MKKTYIIAFIMMVAAIVIFISASGDISTYATFREALAQDDRVKIAGELNREMEVYYNPVKDPNYFSFHMIDSEGESKEVVLRTPKPQDFERSEQVVVTGQMDNNQFVATEILTKCPSKYKDEEIYIRSEG